MRLLSDALVIMATLIFLLFLWVIMNPKVEHQAASVTVGMPVLIVALFILGILARFVKLPKD